MTQPAAHRLAGEASPYLRQHADNPVEWFPWGAEAFDEARRRDVPILLSVGYSACHWCHVMAHECFEDDEVAASMNASFVNVKVDREERPDVDALYMDAVQAMTGRGGWPMTVFATPAGEPFFGGTYFPKPQFLGLLAAVSEAWVNRRAEIGGNVAALAEALGRSARLEPASAAPDAAVLEAALAQLSAGFDAEWGGFGSAPKFPSTMTLDALARVAVLDGRADLAAVVATSLDAMAAGGIYDHLGGGFARYSTDRQWLVPHFEKMLYDQALLVRAYTHAWWAFPGHPSRDGWAQIVAETVGYVLRDLQHPRGGWFSAEDADSPEHDDHAGTGQRHEGRFSTWTPDEVRAASPVHAEELIAWYSLDEDSFEGRAIPHRLGARGQLIRPAGVEEGRAELFDGREARPRPLLDDKVLTEWNALMLGALCEAAAAFGRDEWRDAAVANAEFLLAELRRPDGSWARAWQADARPPARHDAVAADHAALIDAFTRLAELTGQARWIDEARAVAEVLLDEFFDVDHGGLFTTAEHAEQLVVRQKDLLDQATPSANSLATGALYRLAALTGERRYENQADRILLLLAQVIEQVPSAASLAATVADQRRRGLTEVVIPGDDAAAGALLAEVRARWRPDVVLAWGQRYDSPLWEGRSPGAAYVCRNQVCDLPARSPAELAEQLDAGRVERAPGR